jgi:hypothetical protein
MLSVVDSGTGFYALIAGTHPPLEAAAKFNISALELGYVKVGP